jgi:hypothetical protein
MKRRRRKEEEEEVLPGARSLGKNPFSHLAEDALLVHHHQKVLAA